VRGAGLAVVVVLALVGGCTCGAGRSGATGQESAGQPDFGVGPAKRVGTGSQGGRAGSGAGGGQGVGDALSQTRDAVRQLAREAGSGADDSTKCTVDVDVEVTEHVPQSLEETVFGTRAAEDVEVTETKGPCP